MKRTLFINFIDNLERYLIGLKSLVPTNERGYSVWLVCYSRTPSDDKVNIESSKGRPTIDTGRNNHLVNFSISLHLSWLEEKSK